MQDLTISFIQTGNHWHDIDVNLAMFEKKIGEIDSHPDVIILPEMFSTGFSMEAEKLAEPLNGKTTQWMKQQASKSNALILGSIITNDEGKYYNRLIWMQPDGESDYYDKRHLFRMAEEDKYYAMGNRILIKEWKGWKICPLICYDLRFPAWSRNQFDKKTGEAAYDIILYVANWPEARVTAWDALLKARAVENLSYALGVNRIGDDGLGIPYNGHSAVISPKGERLLFANSEDGIFSISFNYDELLKFREKFPAYLDSDDFTIS